MQKEPCLVVERGKGRRKIVDSIHNQANLGMKKQNITSRYYCPELNKIIPSHIVVSHLQIHPRGPELLKDPH